MFQIFGNLDICITAFVKEFAPCKSVRLPGKLFFSEKVPKEQVWTDPSLDFRELTLVMILGKRSEALVTEFTCIEVVNSYWSLIALSALIRRMYSSVSSSSITPRDPPLFLHQSSPRQRSGLQGQHVQKQSHFHASWSNTTISPSRLTSSGQDMEVMGLLVHEIMSTSRR